MLSRLRDGQLRRSSPWHLAGLLLLACLLASTLAVAGSVDDGQVAVEAMPAAGAATADAGVETVTIRFDLPPRRADGDPWVAWFPRSARESIWLEAPGWRSPERAFYAPGADEGLLPGGYTFPLPAEWEGPVEVTLHARPALGGTWQARIMSATDAARLEQAVAGANAAIYGSLLMLAMLALSLYAAARDRVFLTLFACTAAVAALLAAINGHLYTFPGVRLFAHLGTTGLWALVFLFLATWLRLIQQYVGAGLPGARIDRAIDVVFWCLLATTAVCLVGLGLPVGIWWYVAYAFWIVVGVGSLFLLAGAVRRRVAMAVPLLVLLVAVFAMTLMLQLLAEGERLGPLVTRLMYQAGLMAFLAVCAVGLVHRISEYREQRDRDRLARADTERRMLREAARTDLVNALQSRLRQVGQGEVPWTGFRVMADHLLPLLPVDELVVVAEGFHEREFLLVDPGDIKARVLADLGARGLALRRQAANGIALQQALTTPAGLFTEALVPLKLRSPAWGALLLRRAGAGGFAADEMALASEFCRIAQIHVEQALAAIKLRQSAELDALTGSLNRRSIDQWLLRSFAEADRDGLQLSMLFVDLDRFKGINDRYGHAGGDQCLRAVAATLSGALDDGDLFGRYGGEEFIAILPGRGGAAAREVGERLRAAVERLVVDWEGQPIRLTVSVGVATRRDGERTPEATIERADKALYASKRAGRNCVHVAPAVFT